jgi:hypothetical protein
MWPHDKKRGRKERERESTLLFIVAQKKDREKKVQVFSMCVQI